MNGTYNSGFTLKSNKNITKRDIIKLCNLLNNTEEYKNISTFQPEGICGGGIVYKFTDNEQQKWYKSVRLNVTDSDACGVWPWISDDVMNEWNESNDIILDKNKKITIFLKSFYGAPVFTLEELTIFEKYFNQIGLNKVG